MYKDLINIFYLQNHIVRKGNKDTQSKWVRKIKDIYFFVIKIDAPLYDKTKHYAIAVKVEDLTGKVSVPIWSVERESCLEKAVQCKIFYFHTSFTATRLSGEQDIYKISYHLSYVPKAR